MASFGRSLSEARAQEQDEHIDRAGKALKKAVQSLDEARGLVVQASGDLQRARRNNDAKPIRNLASEIAATTGKVDMAGKKLRRGQ